LYGDEFAVRRAETDDDFLSGFVHVLSEHYGKRQGVPERLREMIENRTSEAFWLKEFSQV